MHRRILLLAAFLLLPPAANAAGDAPLDRATLKGLKGVSVVVDVIDPELEKLGLTREAMLARLSARLQARHITIDPAATEFVGLRITAVRASHGPMALSLTWASTSRCCSRAITTCEPPRKPGKWSQLCWSTPRFW